MNYNYLFTLVLEFQTAEQLDNEAEIVGRKKKRTQSNSSMIDGEEELSAQDLMDFSPVYRCMHIYTVLREADTFKAYYRQQRQQQARLVLQPPINMVIFIFHKFSEQILFCSSVLINYIY